MTNVQLLKELEERDLVTSNMMKVMLYAKSKGFNKIDMLGDISIPNSYEKLWRDVCLEVNINRPIDQYFDIVTYANPIHIHWYNRYAYHLLFTVRDSEEYDGLHFIDTQIGKLISLFEAAPDSVLTGCDNIEIPIYQINPNLFEVCTFIKNFNSVNPIGGIKMIFNQLSTDKDNIRKCLNIIRG